VLQSSCMSRGQLPLLGVAYTPLTGSSRATPCWRSHIKRGGSPVRLTCRPPQRASWHDIVVRVTLGSNGALCGSVYMGPPCRQQRAPQWSP
jgi:hypothetical protein